MPLQLVVSTAIGAARQSESIGQDVTVSGAAAPYLIVSALDRNEYPVISTGAVGAFGGNGASLALSGAGGDAREASIVYTWQNGAYVNAVYGSLSSLHFTLSASLDDVTNISFFTTSSAQLAAQTGGDPIALMQADAAGYAGSVTLVDPAKSFTASAVNAATPLGVAAAATAFVGQAWNDEGCWTLASTIAAEAGAGLPVTSTAIGVAGHNNGEWVVVYDGPVKSGTGWQSMVSAGDIVTFGTAGGGGHITTCVSGSGATAMLVDNITYINQSGTITNGAHDGSANDVTVAAAHPGSQEWSGVSANSVVIYALDCPAVSAAAAVKLAAGAKAALSAMATVSDPAGRVITQVQVYDTGTHATLLLNGKAVSTGSAAHALSASALSAITVQAGSLSGTDTLEVRAGNGLYWGDWQSIAVAVGGTATGSTHGLTANAAHGSGAHSWHDAALGVLPAAGHGWSHA